MPQNTKSHVDLSADMELAPPTAHEKLQGWTAPLATDADVRAALDKAFDYRGDVTLTLTSGETIEGYVFDRRSTGATLAQCVVRVIPKDADEKRSLRYDQIAGLIFTGRDTAEGKSFETWVRKYHEKKAAGETNIQLEPEKLD